VAALSRGKILVEKWPANSLIVEPRLGSGQRASERGTNVSGTKSAPLSKGRREKEKGGGTLMIVRSSAFRRRAKFQLCFTKQGAPSSY
jgi:hypothetical protein